MNFRPLCIEDRAWITACRDTVTHPFTALSFASLYLWREAYGLTVAGDADHFAVRSTHDGGFYCPCGDREKCLAFLQTLESRAKVLYLTREQAQELADLGWTVRLRSDLSEYIVSTAAEALREGHISKSFRDKCRRFKIQNEYRARPVTAEDLPLLRRSFLAWRDNPLEKQTVSQSVLRAALDAYEALGMRGILLETAEGELAYILGFENSPGMFTTALTGHSLTLPSETTVISVHELALLLDGEYALLNLEEDLGLEGLRRAKKLYSPVELLEVYEAIKP